MPTRRSKRGAALARTGARRLELVHNRGKGFDLYDCDAGGRRLIAEGLTVPQVSTFLYSSAELLGQWSGRAMTTMIGFTKLLLATRKG